MSPNRIHHADSNAYLPTMPAESVDVVITSPRYNFGKNYHGPKDKTSMADYFKEMETLAAGLLHVVKPEGILFLNIGISSDYPLHDANVAQCFMKAGWTIQERIVWQKANEEGRGHYTPINSDRYLNGVWETVFLLTKTGKVKLDRLALGIPFTDKTNIKRRNHAQDLRCRGDVWFIPYLTIKDRKKQRDNHEATFPNELVVRCLKLVEHGRTGLTVLDPCCGTGTVPCVAFERGHHGVGIDLSEQMAGAAARNLAATITAHAKVPS